MKRVATQADLDTNPELVEAGLKVGDEFEIPDEALNQTANGAEDPPPPPPEDNGGGSNPPAFICRYPQRGR